MCYSLSLRFATPFTVFVSRNWLENYATLIDLSPTPFLLSVLVCLGAVIAAVSFHAFRALRVGPVENLKVLSYTKDPKIEINFPIEWTVSHGKRHVYNSTLGHVWRD
jgi:hypothetical protein